MKRMAACLMALCLAASSIFPARAAESGGTGMQGAIQGSADADGTIGNGAVGVSTIPDGSGGGSGTSTDPSGAGDGNGAATTPEGTADGSGTPTVPEGTGNNNGVSAAPGDGNGAPTVPGGAGDGSGTPTVPGGTGDSNGLPTVPGGTGDSNGLPTVPGGTGDNNGLPTVPGGTGDSNGFPTVPGGTGDSNNLPAVPGDGSGTTTVPDGTGSGNGTLTTPGGAEGEGGTLNPAEGTDANLKTTIDTVSGGVPYGRFLTDWNDKGVSSDPMGSIEVVLRNALPMDNLTVDVALEKDGNTVGSQSVGLEKNPEKHTVSFSVASGTYHLKVSASGFLAFEQDITVKGEVRTAEIHTGFINMEGISYTSDGLHPGVMLIGDANGDGVINDADRETIMDAISAGEAGLTDLNRDGKTDVVDLQYYASGRVQSERGLDTAALLYGHIAPSAVQVNINEGNTKAEGDFAGILSQDGGSVKLSGKDGQAISETNPVEIGFNLVDSSQQGARVEEIVISMGDAAIQSGLLVVETDAGMKTMQISEGQVRELSEEQAKVILEGQAEAVPAMLSLAEESVGRSVPDAGTKQLTVYLGKQVAVKKVSLRITGMAGNLNLAEITKVEFLNDMENRIPEPEMNIPQNVAAEGGNKSFGLTWDPQINITGYEVEISHEGQTETVRAASNRLEVKSFQKEKLVNGEPYGVRVRSVNGTWTSPYSEMIQAVPIVTERPDPPDNLKAVGGVRCIRMSWKDMEDTDTYNVYYKEAGAGSFTKIPDIAENQYVISGLKDLTTYEVYVTGVNSLGESNPSIHSEATTVTLQPAQMPNYKLLNESKGEGQVSAHIVSVTHGRGTMEDSPLDQDAQSALGAVDKDFGSYYYIADWDDGAEYVAANKGLLFTLDDYYKMSYITFAEPEDVASYNKVSVYYYDQENPNGTYAKNVSVLQRTDPNGRKYYLIKLAQPITANKIRLGFARGYGLRNISIAEVNFYYYDSLEDDILALYGDDLHTTLKEGVTEATIRALQERLDTVDAKSGEYHPERTVLQKELDNAKGLLQSGFRDVIKVNTEITAKKDGHLGFSGLNAWQPLGVTAYEGEQLIIYVGHNQLKTGSNSALNLIATQYHAEAGAFASQVATLKVGRNEITVPSIQSLACEGGGALYIQYTGNNANDEYAVRVNGGNREPVLNLYGVTDAQERKTLITDYVKELETHVASQEEQHRQVHETAGAGNKVNRAYDKQNCIIGATDIMLNQMMLSVSAEQILAGLGNGSTEQRAEKLDQSLQAMDGMMHLFYQHKGLSADASAPATDRLPAQHLNIRYMRMFAGAFMYASGNHIGIEWGSVPGLASSSPVVTDGNGKYVAGNYFGWGIAHEIGHNINQGSYAIAEVTNNYFAQLGKSRDSNDTVRFRYADVYKKVTSNTVGKPSNVFIHLAMYWQLHLAYDRGYNFKTYDSYQEQHDNLFYARVDSYSRNTSLAPGGLTLGSDKDQNIMRLACAAAEKDLTEFFVRWGLVPDEGTAAYAVQFPKEERALYYLTDDARVYEIEHGVVGSVKGADVIGQGSSASVNAQIPNEVVISVQDTTGSDAVLGYEIARYHYEDGKPVRQVVGFSTETTYRDVVSCLNNRVLTYEVTAVDKFGYRSQTKVIGDVRIAHDGSHDKSMWTVTTNMVSADDHKDTGTEEDPCDPETVSAVYRILDNDYSNTYLGQSTGGNAEIMLHLNQVLAVCGLKYTVASGTPVSDYEIQVSVDGSNWTTVKSGRFAGQSGSQTVYFENEAKDPWICTYDAAYVKITAPNQSSMHISEIDLLGPTGDSVSFGVRENDTEGAVGILQADYPYESGSGSRVIPAGSLVFTGSYKGNPAYNVVMIYDGDGNVVGGVDADGTVKADQIILANVPENGMLGEVSDGIWIYWIEPENGQLPDLTGKIVRAQLYRVDNALTNEGQRLVSDTLPLQIPAVLDGITLKGSTETGN